MAKRGGLGRGLDALIPKKETAKASSKESEKAKEIEETEYSDEEDLEEETTQSGKGRTSSKQEAANKSSSSNTGLSKSSGDGIPTGDVISMRISKVEPNRDQPRKYFDDTAIEELADSVRQFGIIQPLLVQKKDDYYEIIAGERRWRAAQKAGLKEVPVIVKTFSNQEAVEVSLIENIQREDLNPIEEAKAYERLVNEYGLSQEAVAGRVSKSRSAVANSMRLLKLNEAVQSKVETGELSEGHARAILGVADEELQTLIADTVIKDRLSVRQTEKLVRDQTKPKSKTRQPVTNALDEALLQDLNEKLKAALGTKVTIRPQGKNGGKIEIEYYSEDDLDRIYELLCSVRP